MDLFLEGFDHYATDGAGAMGTRWNLLQSVGATFVPGLNSAGIGKALNMQDRAGSFYGTISFEPTSKMTLHFAINIIRRRVGGFASDIFTFQTATGNRQFAITVNDAGNLVIRGENALAVMTSTAVLQSNLIHRVVLSVDLSVANAAVIRGAINGLADEGLTADAVDLIDAQDDDTQLMGIMLMKAPGDNNFQSECTIDDLILGTGECEDWEPQSVRTGVPTADVLAEWTRISGAANFGMVDDLPFDAEVSYNHTSTDGAKDVFEFGDIGASVNILGVQILNIVRKEESAAQFVKGVLRVGEVDFVGAARPLSESYGHYVNTWLTNPSTLNPWTTAEINALKGGYQYQAG